MRNYRQGDVLFRRIARLPKGEQKKRENGIVAYGESTGHAHSLAESDLDQAEVLEIGDGLYVRVSSGGISLEGVNVVHQEHGTITLPKGNYSVTIQREYSAESIRSVLD